MSLSSRAPPTTVAAATAPSTLTSALACSPAPDMPALPVAGGRGAAALGPLAWFALPTTSPTSGAADDGSVGDCADEPAAGVAVEVLPLDGFANGVVVTVAPFDGVAVGVDPESSSCGVSTRFVPPPPFGGAVAVAVAVAVPVAVAVAVAVPVAVGVDVDVPVAVAVGVAVDVPVAVAVTVAVVIGVGVEVMQLVSSGRPVYGLMTKH